jgi:hypothetical protein
MVGQDDKGIDAEGAFIAGCGDGVTQVVSMAQQQVPTAPRKGNREEDACASDAGAAIIRHVKTLPQQG